MRILLCRSRVGIAQPSYAYRAYVPFAAISAERQALVSMQSDYGFGLGLLARLPDVIAPIAHLEASPGLEKFRQGLLIDGVAGRIGALLLNAAFPEMRERAIPFRLLVPGAPGNAIRAGEMATLAGRYEHLRGALPDLTASQIGLRLDGER